MKTIILNNRKDYNKFVEDHHGLFIPGNGKLLYPLTLYKNESWGYSLKTYQLLYKGEVFTYGGDGFLIK